MSWGAATVWEWLRCVISAVSAVCSLLAFVSAIWSKPLSCRYKAASMAVDTDNSREACCIITNIMSIMIKQRRIFPSLLLRTWTTLTGGWASCMRMEWVCHVTKSKRGDRSGKLPTRGCRRGCASPQRSFTLFALFPLFSLTLTQAVSSRSPPLRQRRPHQQARGAAVVSKSEPRRFHQSLL